MVEQRLQTAATNSRARREDKRLKRQLSDTNKEIAGLNRHDKEGFARLDKRRIEIAARLGMRLHDACLYIEDESLQKAAAG